jgi:Rrf2 family iron-sulfur cluster assembly transcriptional regulator
LTHDLWDELGRQIYLYLSSVSLDDVTNSRILPKGPRVPQFDPAFTTPPTDTLQQDMSDNQ